ncbi:germinal-center associated nuclear protein [Planococcus citri]|uniref:germinal-center associated nuclear protein n=1 Tax=Planococcus citri TaxID=170843 RepID=UPI0031F7F5E3
MTEAEDVDRIEAKCMQMCPASECIKREKERLIHILETDPQNTSKTRIAEKCRMIKSYRRSAAGQELTKPELLRPPAILLQTLDYIFNNVIHDDRVSKIALYNFIDDRLRSIKQDGIVQRLAPETWFQVLVPIVHFYVYSAYTFCEESPNNFDPKLNNDQLIDCLTRFIKLYEDHPSPKYTDSYAKIEALYLIVNFDKVEIINRAVLLELPHQDFQDTVKLVLKSYTNNYCDVFRSLPFMSLLPACLFVALHLNKIRRRALETMSFAYSSKKTEYPISKLKPDLLFNSWDEAIKECQFYGIVVNSENNVQFSKRILNSEANPRRLQHLDTKLAKISLPNLILEIEINNL